MMHKRSLMAVTATIAAAVLLLSFQTQLLAEENPYILLLPISSEIEYDLDSEQISDEYSSDRYMILLYEAGEEVAFQITTDSGYALEDAATGTVFDDYSVSEDGWISFPMPEIDLCFVLGEEYGEESEEEVIEEIDGEVIEENDGEVIGEIVEEEAAAEVPELSETPANGIEIVLQGYDSAELTMTDGTVLTITDGEVFQTEDHVDLFNVYAEEGFSEAPVITVQKNGSVLENDSEVIINRGDYRTRYTVDLANGLDLSNFYLIEVTNPNQVQEAQAAAEEEITAEPDVEIVTVTEEEAQPESQPETEPEIQQETEPELQQEIEQELQQETEEEEASVLVGASVIPASYDDTVERGEDFTFRVELQEGYSRTDEFAVKANGEILEENADGSYTVFDVTDNQVITVEGVADVTAPEVEIFLNGEASPVQAQEDRYTFTEPVTVRMDASDAGSGLALLQYVLSSESFQDPAEITGWSDYTEDLTVAGPGEQILYTKAVDTAGNETDLATAIFIGSARQAPIVFASAETIAGKADGQISGLDTTMEYSTDGVNYVEITDPSMEFAAGTYEVRYAADEEDTASESTEVTIGEGRKLAVIFMAGSEIVDVIEVDYEESIPESDIPDIPEREGYDWMDADWNAESFEHITEDTIFRAVYPEEEFKISFSSDLAGLSSSASNVTGQAIEEEAAEESEEKAAEESEEKEETEDLEAAEKEAEKKEEAEKTEETEDIEGTAEEEGEAGESCEFSVMLFGDLTAEIEMEDGTVKSADQDAALTLRGLIKEVRISSAGQPEILLSQDGREITEEENVYTLKEEEDGTITLTFEEEAITEGTYVLIVSE